MRYALVLAISIVWGIYFPLTYLLGILTTVVPSYIFLFKKGLQKSKWYTSVDRGISNSILVFLFWGIVCIPLWWFFLVVSLSPKLTKSFIYGIAKGADSND